MHTYTAAEARIVLGLPDMKLLRHMSRLYDVPGAYDGRIYRFERVFIDGLRTKIDLAASHGSERADGAMMILYYCHYLYHKLPAHITSASRRRTYRKKITNMCEALVASGRAKTVHQLCEALAAVATRTMVYMWIRRDAIASFYIGKGRYVSDVYFKALVVRMTESEPVSVIAASVGLHADTLRRWGARGDFSIVYGPDGYARVVTRTFEDFKKTNARFTPRTVAIKEAARQLGVGRQQLTAAISRGLVRTVGERKERRVPEEEVERLARRFTTISPGFEWLDAELKKSDSRVRTLDGPEVCDILKISRAGLTRFSQGQLLPFYGYTFGSEGKHHKRFVRRYIDGLLGFCKRMDKAKHKEGRVRKDHLVAYLSLCREAGKIV